MPLVDYLLAREGPPMPSGCAYDYLVAGNGLYVQAENAHLAARIPVARCDMRGLSPLPPTCVLKHGRIPHGLWQHIVDVTQAWAVRGEEVLLTVRHDDRLGYHLVVPRQVVSPTDVAYLPSSNVVLEIHSHHAYRARFSAVDDADEQRLALYGVVGRLNTERPEVALRVGAYGYFMPIGWADVFEGELGGFRDLAVEDPEDEDELSD